MLHVILQILAIIGIILLCILGLFILLILLVLFVPIRYRANGNKKGKDIRLKAKATYLFRLVTVTYEYPEPGGLVARILGFKVVDTAKKSGEEGNRKEKKKKKRRKNKAEEYAEAAINTEAASEKGTKQEEADAAVVCEAKEAAEDKTLSVQQGDAETEGEAFKEKEAEKEKLTFRDKIKKILYTIKTFCDKIKHIKDTIKGIADNIAYYKKVITQTENKKLYGRVKDRIFKVLKSIRPRVLKASLHIGTGSPDTTGYLCALYGMLFPILGNNVILDADFEEAVWEGTFFLKGRITVFTLLRHAAGLLLDKQLRILIKQLKKEA